MGLAFMEHREHAKAIAEHEIATARIHPLDNGVSVTR